MKRNLISIAVLSTLLTGCQNRDELKSELRLQGWRFNAKPGELVTIDLGKAVGGDLDDLLEFPEVERLTLSPSAPNHVLKTVAKLPNLRELYIHDCVNLNKDGLTHLEGMPSLEMVLLGDQRQLTDDDIAPLAKVPNLKSLTIAWGCPNIRGGTSFPRFPNLEELLVIQNSQLSSRLAKELSGMPNLRRLELDLGHYLPDSFWESLITLKHLEEFDLGNRGSTDYTEERLKQLGALGQLRKLRITGLYLTDTGLHHLAAFPELRDLAVSCPNVTNAGLQSIAKLPRLQKLSLRDCSKLSDGGLQHLSRLTSLQTLDLHGTQVGDAGLKEIAAMPSLTRVFFSRAKVTEEGEQELKRAKPDLEIIVR